MRSLLVITLFGILLGCGEPESPHTTPILVGDGINTPQLDPKRKYINICATEWMPFAYSIADKPTGIMVELIQDIAGPLGLEPRFHFMAPQRCYLETQQGRMNLSVFMSPTSLSRSGSQLIAIEPSVQNQIPVLVVRQDDPLLSYPGLDELGDHKIAGLRGNTLMQKHLNSGVEWIPVNQIDYLWQLLMSERIDATLADFQSRVMLTPEQRDAVRILLPPIEVEPIYWAGHKDHYLLIQQLSAELHKRLTNGDVDRFYRRHLGMSFTEMRKMIESGDFLYENSAASDTTPAG